VPWLTLVLIPAIVALCVVVNLFRATSREVVRLDGEARSPVYSSFGDALNARVTLRAFNMQKHVRTRTCHQIDVANSVNLLHKMLDRWNSMRLNAIMTLYAACLYFAAVTIKRQSNLQIASGDDSGAANGGLFDSSVIGLALVYSLQLMGLSSWTAMTFVQTENALTSVERLHQLMSMPQEKEDIKTTDPVVSPKRTTTNEDGTTHEDGTKHKDGTTHEDSTTNTDSVDQKLDIIWPTKGRLVLKNVNLRYRANLPLALNGLNLDVVGGERVGIVGRTGVGKSSVFASVLRLTEPTADSSIALDGIELTSVGLRLIRRDLITLIPQNPVVFSGTIKFNLDPYQEHDIEQLWSMLNDLRMKTTVEARGGLMSDCGKNGSLLSHGQRQLLVVGRALLQNKRTRVYLLDEATSSMDDETDDIVQLAIQKYAQGITTIIVAHRLATVLHCDRIAVMDQGQVIQIGSPKDIAHEVGSPFATMMEKSGIPKDEWPKRSK
jgi:ABC-type multidrug transport system fused ATPase/permease subunit